MFTFENNPLKEVSITAWYIVFWFSSHKTEWTNVIPLSGGILRGEENTQSGTHMFWKTFGSVFGKRSLVRPFLEPFDFVLIRSTTSEMMPCTFSLSPSVLYKKLFTRKAAMYSLYLSETSSRTAVIFLHLWKTFHFLFIVPKSGLFFVSSIELNKELDELNGVDEQHGELRREESSKLASVLNLRWEIHAWSSCTSTSREFILVDLSASKETSSSESWPILVPKDKFFTPWTQSSVAAFIRFTIAINPAELMSSSRIFLLQRGPATRLNVDTMWTTTWILSISTTPNDDLAGWSSRVVAHWISSGNILNISRMKNLGRGTPHTSFKSRYQYLEGSSVALVTLPRFWTVKSTGGRLLLRSYGTWK